MKQFMLPIAAAFLVGATGGTSAHDFGTEGGAYDRFIEGAGTVFGELPVMLAVVALGLLVTLWQTDGLPRVWPAFAAGVLAGTGTGFSIAANPVATGFATAIAVGLLAAASPRMRLRTAAIVAFIGGFMTAFAMVTGHEIGSVPWAALLGIVIALNFVLAASAGLASLTVTRLAGTWSRIALRALASWLVAIAVMGLAFVANTNG